jgi:hypothetical protein
MGWGCAYFSTAVRSTLYTLYENLGKIRLFADRWQGEVKCRTGVVSILYLPTVPKTRVVLRIVGAFAFCMRIGRFDASTLIVFDVLFGGVVPICRRAAFLWASRLDCGR